MAKNNITQIGGRGAEDTGAHKAVLAFEDAVRKLERAAMLVRLTASSDMIDEKVGDALCLVASILEEGLKEANAAANSLEAYAKKRLAAAA